jgi:phosphatidylserine decarboxylase
MGNESIEFFNRYTGKIEREDIYGEGFLRWTYGNPLGKISLEGLAKRTLFSRWYGWRMNRGRSRKKILPFIAKYGLDPSEFARQPGDFRNFNEFFYRQLKTQARPIDQKKDLAVFPADGRHLGFQNLSAAEGIFVKGAKFDLAKLCQDSTLTATYRDGSMVLSRLCPVDYHRFHFPVSGIPGAPRLINGPLYSVSPLALRKNIHYLSENKRSSTIIESQEFGRVLMFEVGATCVGSFEYTFTPGQPVQKGDEKGYFKFGGSETIVLFEPNRIQLDQDLLAQSTQGRELYARMGDSMGSRFA